jgi:hypothetical protein
MINEDVILDMLRSTEPIDSFIAIDVLSVHDINHITHKKAKDIIRLIVIFINGYKVQTSKSRYQYKYPFGKLIRSISRGYERGKFYDEYHKMNVWQKIKYLTNEIRKVPLM